MNFLRFYFFSKDFVYLFTRDTHTERERHRHRQREKQAPCQEPEVGLDPGTPRPHPGPKAGAKPPSHPGIPYFQLTYQIKGKYPKSIKNLPNSTPKEQIIQSRNGQKT